MEKYKCEICGKKHNVFRSIESPLPDLINDIPEDKRGERVIEYDGFYVVDRKHLLASGYIYIELENFDEPIFYWNVWAAISPKDFQAKIEKLKKGIAVELKGKLESELPFYPESKGLKSKVIIQANSELYIEIIIEEESKLKEDQSKPISKNRVIELMQFIHHNEIYREKKVFDKPFSERLKDEILKTEIEYLKKKKDFAINISSSGLVLFQIVSSNILELNKSKKTGFGLHLSFDEAIEEIEKFRKPEYSKEFDYHDLDDVPTYQINLNQDKNRLEELVKKLVVDVYEKDLELIEMDSFEV